MKKVIVTTTINPPTSALLKYAKLSDWSVIVAGDRKTNGALYTNLENVFYMSPEFQESQYKTLSDLIGWNCIQRRNLAILHAYITGADIIAIIDDDNIPYDHWGTDIHVNTPVNVTYFEIDALAFDSLGAHSKYKHLWHRGFPLELIPFRDYSNFRTATLTPKIQAVYWNGDPDVDAVCRMIHNPRCNFDADAFPIASNRPSPFNSQNVIISRDVIPDYFLFPFIGRMDDIWASYYVQSKGHSVVFTKPGVFSDRTLGTVGRYSAIEDMKREYIGMEKNKLLLQDLSVDPESIKKYLPEQSWAAFNEWKIITK